MEKAGDGENSLVTQCFVVRFEGREVRAVRKEGKDNNNDTLLRSKAMSRVCKLLILTSSPEKQKRRSCNWGTGGFRGGILTVDSELENRGGALGPGGFLTCDVRLNEGGKMEKGRKGLSYC